MTANLSKGNHKQTQKIYYSSGFVDAPLYSRENLSRKKEIEGPAFVVDRDFTLIIDPGFKAKADKNGIIVVRRVDPVPLKKPLRENQIPPTPFTRGSEICPATITKGKQIPPTPFTRGSEIPLPVQAAPCTAIAEGRRLYGAGSPPLLREKPDPVLLEVFNNIFMAIATEMGCTLRNTAHSVNIKERLDFSCAVFDGNGNLVANAPHMPVHLGSMADTVKAIIEKHKGNMKPGDIFLSNNPYHGGSHLPDLNVVSPLFSKQGELIFFTASRGHHADIGGITPGSMPPNAEHIDEEGILIDGLLLVRNGIFKEKKIRKILLTHKYPARNPDERMSDLRAQIASCQKGLNELQELVKTYRWNIVRDYIGHIQENAEFCVKQALSQFLDRGKAFEGTFKDCLDDGTLIKVKIVIDGGENPPETVRAVIDFTGTGTQHNKDNLNTPLSVTRSAVLYVLRSLTNRDIPLNSGCLNPVDIIIPENTILSPAYPLPVASGNVETSQRIVDVLLGALKVAGASQGTMNNLLFQVEGENPYYETIAGGSGATEGCPGASGVQTHMTNTRITDPEILECRYPGIRLERFILRKGSGGNGLFPGGDGTIREIKFLKPAVVSIISERRVYRPYGMAGGESGKKGVNLLKRANGEILNLPHRATLNINKGDSIVIETPGGGGYGDIDRNCNKQMPNHK